MRRNIAVIVITLAILSGMQLYVSANPDTGDKKIYHNEKWDILLLYPGDWNYIEEFGNNVPVIMRPPPDEEPEGSVFVYYIGESLYTGIDEMTKEFEEELLGSYKSYEILNKEEGNTREDYPYLDYYYTFVEIPPITGKGNEKIGPYSLNKGKVDFRISYYGTGNFSAVLMDKNDNTVVQLAKFSKENHASKVVDITTPGNFYIKVNSTDDLWEITIDPDDDDSAQTRVSNTRLILTDDGISWMIFFDRPPNSPESIEKEAVKIIESMIFSAAEYLSEEK